MTIMTNQQGEPEALRPIARYKIGYATDDWGARSSAPGGIPDPAGAWVRYKDHVAALVEAQQPAPSAAADLIAALEEACSAINSMKVEAETAGQGDEQMMLEACETISNEGLQADMAIRAALASAPRPAPSAAAFDEHGFRDWVLRNLPKGSIIGNGEWWADHLAAWAKRFVKAAPQPAPVAQGDARAEQALLKVLTAVQRYLPPDGPSAKDTLAEIIGIIDPWPLGDQKGKA